MQRPAGVTILASLYFFAAGIVGLGGILLIFGRSFFAGLAPADAGPPSSPRELELAGLFFSAVALLDLICGIGFIRLQKWARFLAVVYHVAWAAFWALSLFALRLHPSLSSLVFRFAGLAIQVWILVYLFSSPVKQAFAGKAPETG